MHYFEVKITREYQDNRPQRWAVFKIGVLARTEAEAEVAATRRAPLDTRPHTDSTRTTLVLSRIDLTDSTVLYLDADGDY